MKDLLKLVVGVKSRLTQWETTFVNDLISKVKDPSVTFSQHTVKKLTEIHDKHIKKSSPVVESSFCGECSTGWHPYVYIPTGQVVALRCECMGGTEGLASYLRSKGDKSLAERMLKDAAEIKSGDSNWRAWEKSIDQPPPTKTVLQSPVDDVIPF